MIKLEIKKIKLILIALLSLFIQQIKAQQQGVDSIVKLLNTGIKATPIDSTSLDTAFNLITRTTLNTKQIATLESIAQEFLALRKTDLASNIYETILVSLTKTDSEKAITYGKLQVEMLDQLNTAESKNQKDRILNYLRFPYRNSNRLKDGIVYYSDKLNQYKKQSDSNLVATSYYVLGGFYNVSGLNDLAIYNMKKSLSYIDTLKSKARWSNNIGVLGSYYLSKNDLNEGLKYSKIALKEDLKANGSYNYSAGVVAKYMLKLQQLDSVAYYLSISKQDIIEGEDSEVTYLQIEAEYYLEIDNLTAAENNLKRCWQIIETNNIPVLPGSGVIAPDYYLALIRIAQEKYDEAITLLKSDVERLKNVREDILRNYKLMAQLYQITGQNDLASETFERFITLKDSLLADQDKLRVIGFEAEQKMNENELFIEKLESENKISSLIKNFSIGIAILFLFLSANIYFRFRSKKKANGILNTTLAHLKSAQAQLVQSEKMASLGELTAGIAHEIQNPLNFVNNFSEVSKELLEEMVEELKNGDMEEVDAIANDVIQNLEKILHHGQRADGIVKGMLQHSRTNAGEKELTDINLLVDEYLRLAYHGLRAKDKSFNAKIVTNLDDTIEKLQLVPQDIGRVLLNLITNAFHACTEKQKTLPETEKKDFHPTVEVTTKKEKNCINISVKDNGNGVPEHIVDKIFQPFFTTKPTGQGTGLGLSLSYDIVKALGGQLTLETKDQRGSSFSIIIPTE